LRSQKKLHFFAYIGRKDHVSRAVWGAAGTIYLEKLVSIKNETKTLKQLGDTVSSLDQEFWRKDQRKEIK